MLVVKPSTDQEIKRLDAYVDDEMCGYVRFHLRGYIIVIDELIPLVEDPENINGETYAVLDAIIRALGSYGLNHSCFYLECREPMLYPTLSALRFSMSDGMMKSTLAQILKACGH